MNENCPQLYGFYKEPHCDLPTYAWCYYIDNLYFYFAKSTEIEDTLHFCKYTVEDFVRSGMVGIRADEENVALSHIANGVFDVLYEDITKFRCIDYTGTGRDIIMLSKAFEKMEIVHPWFYNMRHPF